MYISFVDEHGLVSSQYFEAHIKVSLKTSFEYLNILRMHISLVLNQIMIHRSNQIYIE